MSTVHFNIVISWIAFHFFSVTFLSHKFVGIHQNLFYIYLYVLLDTFQVLSVCLHCILLSFLYFFFSLSHFFRSLLLLMLYLFIFLCNSLICLHCCAFYIVGCHFNICDKCDSIDQRVRVYICVYRFIHQKRTPVWLESLLSHCRLYELLFMK